MNERCKRLLFTVGILTVYVLDWLNPPMRGVNQAGFLLPFLPLIIGGTL